MDICLFIVIPAFNEVILYILHHMRLINYLHGVLDQVPTLLLVDPQLFGFVHSSNGFNNIKTRSGIYTEFVPYIVQNANHNNFALI